MFAPMTSPASAKARLRIAFGKCVILVGPFAARQPVKLTALMASKMRHGRAQRKYRLSSGSIGLSYAATEEPDRQAVAVKPPAVNMLA